MNLVCRKSKIRGKTGLGARGRRQSQSGDWGWLSGCFCLGAWGRRQSQSGDWGWLSGCFSQIREIREKTDFRGGKNKWEGGGGREHLASVQWKQVYATLPYLTTSTLWAGLREKTRKQHKHTDKKDMKRTHWSDNSKHSLDERNYK